MSAPTGTVYPGSLDTGSVIGTAVASGETISSAYGNTTASAVIAIETAIGENPTQGTPYSSIGSAIQNLPTALCEGRLTLASGTPITTTDINNASTIYFTPYNGYRIALYDGVSAWHAIAFSETAITLSGLTTGTVYDLFAHNQSGTLAFDAPLAWSSTTARATGLTLQNGVWVKSTDKTRRYLGTFYAVSSTATSDSSTPSGTSQGRFLFNAQNRAYRLIQAASSTNYNTSSTTPISPDALHLMSAFVAGLADQPVRVFWQLTAYMNSTTYAGVIGVSSSSGGTVLTPGLKTVNLATFHTETGEQTVAAPLGLCTQYLTYYVNNTAAILYIYPYYGQTGFATYLWS